jgi:hypothetical protein
MSAENEVMVNHTYQGVNIYVGRLKSDAHMLVEREQKQIGRSGKK